MLQKEEGRPERVSVYVLKTSPGKAAKPPFFIPRGMSYYFRKDVALVL
jgi:hypothetical protein